MIAEASAGGDMRLTSRGQLVNYGFVGTAGNLLMTAGSRLENRALLYAGNNMQLLASSIQNNRGDILANNSLWLQRDAAGNASDEVINTSGNIETSLGDITIRTGHLLNQREGLVIRFPTGSDRCACGSWTSYHQDETRSAE